MHFCYDIMLWPLKDGKGGLAYAASNNHR